MSQLSSSSLSESASSSSVSSSSSSLQIQPQIQPQQLQLSTDVIKLKRLIQLLAFTSLHVIRFPKYPCYYYAAFLCIQLIKRYKKMLLKSFRLVPIPKKFYNLLIKNEFLKSEHYCFVSETIYDEFIIQQQQQLHINKNFNWLNLYFLNKSRVTMNSTIPTILPPIVSTSTSTTFNDNKNEYHHDNKLNNNINVCVPILQINNCQSNCIFINENCYYNFIQKYKFNENELLYVKLNKFKQQPKNDMQSLEEKLQIQLPKLATIVTIFIINNPYELTTNITDDIINRYFENSHILYRNYTYEIQLDDLLFGTHLYSKHFSIFSQLKKIYFRCVHIESKDNPFELYAIVTKGLTNLHQTTSINYPVPRQKLHDLCFIDICPYGLRKYYQKLKLSIQPFLQQSTYFNNNATVTTNSNTINNNNTNNNDNNYVEGNNNLLTLRNIFPIFLLQGDRGSGKSTILNALSLNLGIQMYNINCSEIISQIPAQTEAKLNIVFGKSRICEPLIICLQNFEIFGIDTNGHEDLRLITMFQTELHRLFINKNNRNNHNNNINNNNNNLGSSQQNQKQQQYPIIIIAITNERHLKPIIQRLFLEIIKIQIPTIDERFTILKWLNLKEYITEEIYNKYIDNISTLQQLNININNNYNMENLKINNDLLKTIADKTQGFLYGDLKLLYDNSIKFIKFQNNNNLTNDSSLKFEEQFEKQLTIMQQSFADSLGAPKVPTILWSDIGGLAKLKDEIQNSIGLPLKHLHLMGKNMRRSGILLYGPPGTGKTLVAKAVATECNLNFLSVQGPELLNMYVGQSEQNVREVFARARSAAPCVIFLDELDSLAPNRGVAGDSGGVMDRVVSQLLAEMDGIITNDDDDDDDDADANNNLNELQRKQIFILAATNRPDLIDPALLRPGRFDKLLYVGPCISVDDKIAVLIAQMKKFTLEKELNIKSIAELLKQDMTGADLYSICSNAWLSAVRRTILAYEKGKLSTEELLPENVIVNLNDFKIAADNFVPSVAKKDLEYFNKLKSDFGST